MENKKIKKKYNAPKLESQSIDCGISLVMMTIPPNDPSPFGNVEVEDRHDDPSSSKFGIADEHSDVFGGSTPKY